MSAANFLMSKIDAFINIKTKRPRTLQTPTRSLQMASFASLELDSFAYYMKGHAMDVVRLSCRHGGDMVKKRTVF